MYVTPILLKTIRKYVDTYTPLITSRHSTDFPFRMNLFIRIKYLDLTDHSLSSK